MASFDYKFNSTPLGGFSYDFAPASGRGDVSTDTISAGLPIVTNNKTTRKHERVNLDGSINQQGKSYKSCACGLMAASNRQGKCNVCGDATRWIKKARKRSSCRNARPKKRQKKEQSLDFFNDIVLELTPAEQAEYASLMELTQTDKSEAEFKAKEQAIAIREQALSKSEAEFKAKEQAIAEFKTPAFSLELDEEDLFNIASMEAELNF